MIEFSDESKELDMTSIKGGWRLNEDVPVKFDHRKNIVAIVVERGFECDLASIPAILRPYVSNDDYRVRTPSILHDYLYKKRGMVVHATFSWVKNIKLSRKDCDRLFCEALRFYGMSKTKAWLMWLAVRVGGWKAWDHV